MIIAALTGGIASGKTEVLKEAKSFSGVKTVQADDVAKEVYNPDNPCFDQVLDLFGARILEDDGSVNLKRVSEIVFSDTKILEELEKITHPYVKGRLEGLLESYEKENTDLTLIEIPLLFQSSGEDFNIFDRVILVEVPEEEQLRRLVERDGISEKEAKKRIELQKPPKIAREKSDFVINADETVEETRHQAQALIKELLN